MRFAKDKNAIERTFKQHFGVVHLNDPAVRYHLHVEGEFFVEFYIKEGFVEVYSGVSLLLEPHVTNTFAIRPKP